MERIEPSDLELALWERGGTSGWPYVGPLTYEQTKHEDAYLRYCDEREREYELEQKHGGRTRCPNCDEFEVNHQTVLTYGVPSNPNSEYSDYAECSSCGWSVL